MKKIVFVTNSLWNGGAQRVLLLLASSFNTKNYHVKVISVNKTEENYDTDKLDIIYLSEVGEQVKKFARIRKLKKVLRQEKADVIISFEYFLNMDTIVAARGLKAKVIVSERNDPAQQNDRKLVKKLRDYLYKKADVLVCQTPDAKAYFPQKVQDKAVIIPNPIKSNLPKYHGEDSKTIINFCRLEKQKNLPLLVDAFELLYKENKDYRLVIYGNGSGRDSLTEYIRAKGLQDAISVNGAVKNIHEIACSCKMFVSSSDYEGLSNSMLEAMAMGMPVVCTDCPCGGARMVINDGVNGLLVPVKDVNALYSAMKKIISDSNLAANLSENAAKIAETLSEEKISESWNELL